jgi:hypothetical protein
VADRTKWVRWIGAAMSILASLVFVMSAVMKLIGGPEVAKGMDHLQLAHTMLTPLGVLELSCVAVYLVPHTAVLGAILMTGYVGGAILTHWRVGDPFLTHIVLGAFIWVGIYLREPRLKQLIPVRRGDAGAAAASGTGRTASAP